MNLRWKIAQAAELRWWKNYLKNKTVDKYLQDKKAYWQRVLKEIGTEWLPEQKILDAGCGPAGIFILSDDQNHRVDALDPLLNYYEKSLPHFNKIDYPKVHFFAQALENFEPATMYDTIFCLNAINHVADLTKSLQQLHKILAPNGQLILSTDAHKHAWLKPIFKLLPGDILHPHQYDLPEYRALLLTHGFRIEKEMCLKEGNIFDYWLWVLRKK